MPRRLCPSFTLPSAWLRTFDVDFRLVPISQAAGLSAALLTFSPVASRSSCVLRSLLTLFNAFNAFRAFTFVAI